MMMMLHCKHGSPQPSLISCPYHPLLLEGLPGYILYQPKAVVISSSWSSYLCSSMWREPLEHIDYEFVFTSPAKSCRSGSSNFDNFPDGQLVAVLLLFCGVLTPGCSIQPATFLCNCRQAFSPYMSLTSMGYIHLAVSIQPQQVYKDKNERKICLNFFYCADAFWLQTLSEHKNILSKLLLYEK